MGLEARCPVSWHDKTWNAAVHLDSAAVEVRGRPRLVLAFADIRQARCEAGVLELDTADGSLRLELGAAAPRWAQKIPSPPDRAKKLGIKAGVRVSVVGLSDAAFEHELTAAGVERVGARDRTDLVFLGVDSPAALERLAAARARIEPDGAIWIVRLEGKNAVVKESEVRECARGAGLVDVKVASFSDTHSADKFVIPAAERALKKAPRATKALATKAPQAVKATRTAKAPATKASRTAKAPQATKAPAAKAPRAAKRGA